MKKITVKTEKPYDVIVDYKLLDEDIIKYLPDANKKAVIIWDETIDPAPVEKLGAMLEKSDVECLALSVKGGESCKTLETYARIIDHLTNFRLDKSNLIISVGGGSVSDLAGFVASTYMRGVKFVNVPTTVLSQVDAAVGGKTALNYNQHKNLIGVINQPYAVLIDTSLIESLSEEEYASGVSEIIKIAFMRDENLATRLKDKPLVLNREDSEYVMEIISRAIELKAEIVSSDENNRGERNLLNFGHTFGHAIEATSGYKFGHGVSVALGMVIITKMAENGRLDEGLTEAGTLNELKETLRANRLKVDSPYDLKTLIDSVIYDKKVEGEEITLIVPKRKGEGKLIRIKVDSLKKII